MPFSLLGFLVFSASISASIFDADDRIDTKNASSFAQELGKSVPALVQTKRLIFRDDQKIELKGTPLTKLDLCATEAFAEESNIANCSASFIGGNRILTAAHCFDHKAHACDTYSVVFGYARETIPMAGPHVLGPEDVYHCKAIRFYQFDRRRPGVDLAIVELDRDVVGRKPVKLDLTQSLRSGDPLMMIGYPLGISQKVVENGKVLSVDHKLVSFKHDLDSFSVNSGGPIFSPDGTQVGVLVRGTGTNFSRVDQNATCSLWDVDDGRGYAEGNDLSALSGVIK